jgi:hypothetical protein
LWIIGSFIALAVIVWALIPSRRNPPRVNAPEKVATSATANKPAIMAYLTFADETSNRLNVRSEKGASANQANRAAGDASIPAMRTPHAFSAEGLRRLAGAIAALSGSASDSVAAALRSDADALEHNPRSLEHADIIRRAFERAAQALGERDAQAGDRLRRMARSINTSRPLLEQRDEIERFFVAAADVIRSQVASGAA